MKIYLGIILVIMTCAGLRAQVDVTVPAQTIASGTTNITASRDIVTSGTVTVSSGAILNLKAGRSIDLKPGFHASSGAGFHAWLDATILDTDGDGIPDVWETANGLNPNNPSDAAATSSGNSDLTNLDCYLLGVSPGTAISSGSLNMNVHRPK